VLTGYVPDYLAGQSRSRLLGERPITLGYRGRDLSARYGRLAFDKYEIGRRMREICLERGISHDIAMDEESRIYGPAWFDFIASCRAMLGSESGANVFDFDGSLERKYCEATAANGGRRPSYDEFLPLVAEREREIDMGQVSPRVFECAAQMTPIVLFEGRYSNVVVPHEHYIPLRKDFSNVDEVLARLADTEALEAMATRAYRDLVESGRFGYRAFVRRVDDIVAEELERRSPARSTPVAVGASVGQLLAIDGATDAPLPAAHYHARTHTRQIANYLDEIARLEAIEAETIEQFGHSLAIFRSSPAIAEAGYRMLCDNLERLIASLPEALAQSRDERQSADGLQDYLPSTDVDLLKSIEAMLQRQLVRAYAAYDEMNRAYAAATSAYGIECARSDFTEAAAEPSLQGDSDDHKRGIARDLGEIAQLEAIEAETIERYRQSLAMFKSSPAINDIRYRTLCDSFARLIADTTETLARSRDERQASDELRDYRESLDIGLLTAVGAMLQDQLVKAYALFDELIKTYAPLASTYEREYFRSKLPTIVAEIDALVQHGTTTLLPNYQSALETLRLVEARRDRAVYRAQLAEFTGILGRARREFDSAAGERETLSRSLISLGDQDNFAQLAQRGQTVVGHLYALVDEMQRAYVELERGAHP
jgi:hypothetical protein